MPGGCMPQHGTHVGVAGRSFALGVLPITERSAPGWQRLEGWCRLSQTSTPLLLLSLLVVLEGWCSLPPTPYHPQPSPTLRGLAGF